MNPIPILITMQTLTIRYYRNNKNACTTQRQPFEVSLLHSYMRTHHNPSQCHNRMKTIANYKQVKNSNEATKQQTIWNKVLLFGIVGKKRIQQFACLQRSKATITMQNENNTKKKTTTQNDLRTNVSIGVVLTLTLSWQKFSVSTMYGNIDWHAHTHTHTHTHRHAHANKHFNMSICQRHAHTHPQHSTDNCLSDFFQLLINRSPCLIAMVDVYLSINECVLLVILLTLSGCFTV